MTPSLVRLWRVRDRWPRTAVETVLGKPWVCSLLVVLLAERKAQRGLLGGETQSRHHLD